MIRSFRFASIAKRKGMPQVIWFGVKSLLFFSCRRAISALVTWNCGVQLKLRICTRQIQMWSFSMEEVHFLKVCTFNLILDLFSKCSNQFSFSHVAKCGLFLFSIEDHHRDNVNIFMGIDNLPIVDNCFWKKHFYSKLAVYINFTYSRCHCKKLRIVYHRFIF